MAKWSISSAALAPVPPEAIFPFYVDPSTWGSYGHNTRWARARGPVVEGALSTSRLATGRSTRCSCAESSNAKFGRRACSSRRRFQWIVPTGSRVEHTITVSGRFARATKLIGFDRLYTKFLQREVATLIALAVRRAAMAVERPADRPPHPEFTGR